MSLLDLLRRPDLGQGLARARGTADAVLLDVRMAEEYAAGHVPGSVNLPLDRLEAIALPRETPLFVYCYSGARSGQACRKLQAMGYRCENIGGLAGYRGSLER